MFSKRSTNQTAKMLLGMVVLLACSQVQGGTYVVTFPNNLIPGTPLMVRVTVLEASLTVNVEASVETIDNAVVAKANGSVTTGTPSVIKIPIAEDLPESEYKVVVHGSGGLYFRNESAIRFEENSVLIFIQTDKSRYSGGQEVKYRVLFMKPNLMPYEGPVTLTLHDGEDNMIEREEYKNTRKGVVNGTLLLAREPVFGTWSITGGATHMRKTYTKTFEVHDYVLPKFEVTVTVPSKLTVSTNFFIVSVKARFTFMTDVYGNCTIQIYNPYDTIKYVEYSQQIIGVVNFTVAMDDLKRNIKLYEAVKVRALVSDNATFLTMASETNLEILREKKILTVTVVDTRYYFLPGMIYQTPIIVQLDSKTPGFKGILTVSPTVMKAAIQTCYLQTPPTKWLEVRDSKRAVFTINFDEKGYGVLKFNTEQSADQIKLKFSVSGSTESFSFSIYAFSKTYAGYIGLSADKGSAKVGERVWVQADATEKLEGPMMFELISRGTVLQSERVQINQANTASMYFTLTEDMIPLSHVVMTYVKGNNIVVRNHVSILVDGVPFKNPVSVEVNGTSFQTGDGITFTLSASPGSTVHMLIEDERNRLLGDYNDIFAEEIEPKLWNVGHVNSFPKRISRNTAVDHRLHKRATEPWNENGVVVLTDCNFLVQTPRGILPIFNPQNLPTNCEPPTTTTPSEDGQWVPIDSEGTDIDYDGWDRLEPTPEESLTALQLTQIVRSRFPETWLWEEYDIGATGQVNVTKNVPDSVTTWVTSVFATSTDTGIGIPEDKLNIQVKRNFFLTITLPTSVILGEEFLLQITVFSFLGRRIQVQLQIDRSDDPLNPIPAATVVQDSEGHSTFAKVTPKKTGVLTFTVRARAGDFFTTYAVDMIERKVDVRPLGIRKTVNHQRLVILGLNSYPYRETIPLGNFPNTVTGSRQLHMTVTGDMMVPTISGLQSLIVEPHGCGEQNMVNFAPDVFLTKYMKVTGQLTPKIEKNSLSNVTTGYQNELVYKRHDGSYSAFRHDRYGGTWLTAYVLKSFYQAKDLIYIDPAVLDSATSWILGKQNDDGSFIEQNPVRYVDHPFSQLRLAAFVVIALMETDDSSRRNTFPNLKNVIDKGVTYLEATLPRTNDAYSLSITCYALAKYGSRFKDVCFSKLQNGKILISQDGMTHWTDNAQSNPTSNDIESTGYALLTYISLGLHTEAVPIVKWLVSQRSPRGGYKTTQDTVISIQALTEYSQQTINSFHNPDNTVHVVATGTGFTHTYEISNKNYNTTQLHEMPATLMNLDIEVSGNGIAVFDIVETFYVSKVQDHQDINVTATVIEETINSVTVLQLLRWLGRSTSSMLLMEIEMPTGFGADIEFVRNETLIRKSEVHGQTFVLYFDPLRPGETIQVLVKMDRVDPVVGNQACHVTVYDYYEPEKQAVTTYESGVLKRANICHVCPFCSWCTEGVLPIAGRK